MSLALRWKLKATFQKDFGRHSGASNKDVELEGVEILHFEGDKLNEAWTVSDFFQIEVAKVIDYRYSRAEANSSTTS